MTRSKRKPPRWKRDQKAKKVEEKKSKAILGVIFLISILVLVVTGILWKKTKNSIWDGEANIGVVYQKNDKIELKVLLIESNRLVLLKIPGSTLVQAGFGYGDYQLKNIYKLGKLEGYGGKVLSRATGGLLGVNALGFVVDRDSNLTWWDKLRVFWFEKILVKKKSIFDLAEHEAFTQEETGGEAVFRVSQILIDEFINKQIFDERLINESLSIGVLNASGEEGIAKNVSRMISNAGGEIRLVSNTDEQNSSRILVANKKIENSFIIKFLKNLALINQVEITDIDEYRSDIVLIIGKDYTNLK